MKSFFDSIRSQAGSLIGILIALGVVIAIAATTLAAICGGSVPLPEGETCTQCIRSWVGASSGWAAAFGAMLTAILLLTQIKEMRQQNDYLVGKLPVDLRAIRYDHESEVFAMSIVNRNFNTIHLEGLRTEPNGNVWIYPEDDDLAPQGETNTGGHGHKSWIWTEERIIQGWHDKSRLPFFLNLEIKFWDDNGEPQTGSATLILEYRFMGSNSIQSTACEIDLDFYRNRH